ncbi:MAG: hypothetical protein HZY77_10980 [Thiobacillus sp.]|uniref:hypothetical protein n=1 Tax=Thiobacillus sp. TaxID=924 RepID=UPI00168C9A83|nr:hypothetical protein [Thiobacillus sp.]QLQ03230.1 MAG: hypothetical protein HZY77_10980 [Thiobacillus sp.]
MKNNLNQIQNLQTQMDLKLSAARTIMTAIDALFANSVIKIAGDDLGNEDIHTLVLIALDHAREAESMSAELEVAIRLARQAA